MEMTDARLEIQQSNNPMADAYLETAYLYLLDEFRKAFISDQVQRESRLYEKLSQTIGISDDSSSLKLFAQKILTNLKYWGKNEKLLLGTLNLLNDLTIGYSSVRRLVKTEHIQFLLHNHYTFEFVSNANDVTIMRTRTHYYSCLMRILNIELEEDPNLFGLFMKPITEKFDAIKNVFANIASFKKTNTEVQLRFAIIGFCRDIRGIAGSCTKKVNFTFLLNWALVNLFTILMESIKLWADMADVTTPVLKLISELTMNRQSRLTYDMHTCTSVVLFREVSKIISEYGRRLLELPSISDKDNFYKERVKNIGVICCILRNVLSGSYLPFGVFWLYGDGCLNDSLLTSFRLFLNLQQHNFLVYTKLAQVTYYFIDIITRDNMVFVSKLDEQYFIAILRAVHRGILGVDTTIISTSCTILDQILDFVFDHLTNQPKAQPSPAREPEGDKWRSALETEPDILYELMNSIFCQIIFEDVKCQWSMSRPLLGLIILNEKVGRYQSCKMEMIRQQPTHLQQTFEQLFEKLMEGVKDIVNSKNKDIFTHNLSGFRKEIELLMRGQKDPTNESAEEDTQFMTD